MIDQFIQRLQAAGLELSDRELAESLWLARHLPVSKRRALEAFDAPRQPSYPKLEPEPEDPRQESGEGSLSSEARTAKRAPEAFAALPPAPSRAPVQAGGDRLLEFHSPSASALPHKLELARALRALRRRVPSRLRTTLDEVATAERIANQGLWVPVLRPARTRWLDAILVVDRGRSMGIWRKTLSELERVLQSQGAFRDVRTWELDTNEAREPVRLRPVGSGVLLQRSPQELIDTRGRRLILVVSDCVSPAWHSGAVARLLEEWGRHGPVAIVQLLPRSLWGRTALRRGVAAGFHARSPGVPNRKLESRPLGARANDDRHRLAMPVVTLEKDSLERWARLVAGRPMTWAPGVLLSHEPLDARQPVAVPETRSRLAALTAVERVRRFRGTASPTAQTLAGLLAATPLNLPVMRLVLQTMLPEAEQVHLAEVFLGGLIHEVRTDEPPRNPDEVQYDFHEGVRELLLESVSISDSIEVLRRTSRFLEKRLGHSLDFRAVLSDPGVPAAREFRPFAHVSATVLRRLGGEYAELADRLEGREVPAPAPAQELQREAASQEEEKRPVRPLHGPLAWSKKLSASDAQRVKEGSNPVGGIRLTQARFKFEGTPIDHTSYFRVQLFGRYQWGIKSSKPYVESTTVPFDVTILGHHLGVFVLELSHKPSGEAEQRNYTTILHLGPLREFFRDYDVQGHLFNLHAPAEANAPFVIDII
jgi:hypothetical protein